MLQSHSNFVHIAQEHQEEHDVHHISIHAAERTEFPINLYALVHYESL